MPEKNDNNDSNELGIFVLVVIIHLLLFAIAGLFNKYPDWASPGSFLHIIFNKVIPLYGLCLVIVLLVCHKIYKRQFPLLISIDEKYFSIKSEKTGYEAQEDACVVLCKKKGKINSTEDILSIGRRKETIENNPEFYQLQQEHEVRFINPFKSSMFDPLLARSVITFYAHMSSQPFINKSTGFKYIFYRHMPFISYNLKLQLSHRLQITHKQKKDLIKFIKQITPLNKNNLSIEIV